MNPDRDQANQDWINSWPTDKRSTYLKWLDRQPDRKKAWLKSLWPLDQRAGTVPCRRRCGNDTDAISQVCADCRLSYFQRYGADRSLSYSRETERWSP